MTESELRSIDVAARKEAEDALRISEAKLRGIIGIAAEAIISIDDAQRIIMYNRGAEAIFGWTAAEAMGQPLTLLMPLRFGRTHGQLVRQFGAGDVTARRMGERMPAITCVRKDGREFSAQAAISKLDIEGVQLFTVVLRDITEQLQRERASELLAGLGAALMDTFLDQDATLATVARMIVPELADCCIVDVVAAGERAERVEVRHRDPSQAALCERLRVLTADLARARLALSPADAQQPHLLPSVAPADLASLSRDPRFVAAIHDLGPQSLMVVPLLAHGEPLGSLVLISTDAGRRYGEADLSLAQEVAARAALAVENAQLHESARRALHDLREANEEMVGATIHALELTEAAEAARALTEERERELRQVAEFRELFIGIVGHDLRTPLSSITLAATLIRRHAKLDERDDKSLSRIIHGSERMTRMISQLLDLTRARLGGGFPLDGKPTDLRELCRCVVEEFDHPIELAIDGDVTGVWDADRLVELLSNILGNAIEHAQPGTPLGLHAYSEGNDVVIEISNEGNPIPAELLPTIFEPFRRGRQCEKSSAGNLGLGLFIAKQIVLSHGGTIVARSADGVTTFVMRLPRQLPSSAATTHGDAAACAMTAD